MVTTNCQEVAGSNCTLPLSGETLDELKQTIFAHAQAHHPDVLKKMSSEDQANINLKIEAIYRQKTLAAAQLS